MKAAGCVVVVVKLEADNEHRTTRHEAVVLNSASARRSSTGMLCHVFVVVREMHEGIESIRRLYDSFAVCMYACCVKRDVA